MMLVALNGSQDHAALKCMLHADKYYFYFVILPTVLLYLPTFSSSETIIGLSESLITTGGRDSPDICSTETYQSTESTN